ncbi:MAG: C-type lectin domain-containing protein, partial [Clostridiales bacterium]|nr:C-type lectin domain-containing protein [Clostridiales bacterium]
MKRDMIRKVLSLALISSFTLLSASCTASFDSLKDGETEEDEETVEQSRSSSGTTSRVTEESSEETEASEEPEETEPFEVPDILSGDTLWGIEPGAEWCQAYIDFIYDAENYWGDTHPDHPEDYQYTLIYLDCDEVPELFIKSNNEADGETICTYHDGEVVQMGLSRTGTTYIPGSGLLYTDTGNMGWYPVLISRLEDGAFSYVAGGTYYITEEEMALSATDEDHEIVYTYEWGGTEVTEDQFYENINDIYDMDQGIEPTNWFALDEFINVLETGHYDSYDHEYELIEGNINYQQAKQECENRGGYLVVISNDFEARVIADLIEEEGMEDHFFYTGYLAPQEIGDTFYHRGFYYPDMTSPTDSSTEDGVYVDYTFIY